MLVNMCWGYGCAYDSKVLPRAPVAQNLNWEPLDACRAACRRQGIKMHVWRVCWQVFGPPRSEVDARKKLAAEGRMQIDYDGNVSQNWLCPNHPANRSTGRPCSFFSSVLAALSAALRSALPITATRPACIPATH
jgi:hypothetical protein